MIDSYINASRKNKPCPEGIQLHYGMYFNGLCLQLPFATDVPTFTIAYSVERSCELATIKEKKFLIYDQYLGQSFNHLNRINFAKSHQDSLSQSYGCKYVAEKLLVKGELELASFFALTSLSFKENIKNKKPFTLSDEEEGRRNALIVVQEIFVIAHELAHHIYDINVDAGMHPDDKTEKNLKEYIESIKNKQFTDSDHQEALKRYGKEIADDLKSSEGVRYDFFLDTLNEKNNELLSEVFADDLGALLTFRLASELYKIPAETICEAIILSFKYLRLFCHLDLLVDELKKVRYATDGEQLKSLLEQLANKIWGNEDRKIRTKFNQLREHFLRERLQLVSTIAGFEPNKFENKLRDAVDHYDRYIEGPIVFELVDKLSKILDFELVNNLNSKNKSDEELVTLIDKITGWDS